jgi:ubiquinone/menaquinone biosynthesis C-methylase UbiE
MARHERKLIGLDFSAVALNAARRVGRMDSLIQADIFASPLRTQSVDGIWNLGVMEHFTETEIRTCLREFRRVLKPGGVILLFWPAEKNASRWILGPLESIISRRQGLNFTFFPGEISRLHSKRQARQLIESEGFHVNAIDLNWRTAFIHMVIAATAN